METGYPYHNSDTHTSENEYSMPLPPKMDTQYPYLGRIDTSYRRKWIPDIPTDEKWICSNISKTKHLAPACPEIDTFCKFRFL